MMNAYDELYLEKARIVLARMLDYAVHDLQYEIGEIWNMFLVSNQSKQFEEGDFSVLAGKSGVELTYDVVYYGTGEYPEMEPTFVIERRPEYWTGWVLAYYQWKTSLSFAEITRHISIEEVSDLYEPYHEMDIQQFVDKMNELYLLKKYITNLKKRREKSGMSQRILAEKSNVPLRTIQQYEQRQKDINKANAESLFNLAKVLRCPIEDIIEKVKPCD